MEKCPDDVFISPVVITVKKDKSVKLALDSKKLNKAIHKNKNQIQSIDHRLSKNDLKYAYSQIPLDESIAKHCKFSILGGRATGTYRFKNGSYGLTDMPATFQKTIYKTLEGINSKFAFLDDILVITKGSLNEHENELDTILSKTNVSIGTKYIHKFSITIKKIKQIIENKHFDTTNERASNTTLAIKVSVPLLKKNMTMYGTP